jgi:hypothetical protein
MQPGAKNEGLLVSKNRHPRRCGRRGPTRPTTTRPGDSPRRNGRSRSCGLLAGPPRNECPDDVIVWVRRQGKRVSAECNQGSPPPRVLADAADEEAVWVSEEGLIAVRFAQDGRLSEKYYSMVHGPDGNRLQLAVRRMFGRRASSAPAKAPAPVTPVSSAKAG